MDSQTQCCCLPPTPGRLLTGIDDVRARLIRTIEKKWMSGTELTYYLFDGPADDQALVRQAFDLWAETGLGVIFKEVNTLSAAKLRIGFEHGDGSWSYVGTDNLTVPAPAARTMNFGWPLNRDPRGIDVALHEIGHALGFPHEHQNPFSGIQWNDEEVYRAFSAPPNNWNRQETYWNVLRQFSPQEVEGSEWDPNSIMHYGFGPGLINEPARYRNGVRPAGGLSATDKSRAVLFYPQEIAVRTARELQAQVLDLAPAEQVRINLAPTRDDTYTITSFGRSDIVMELLDDEGTVIASDDDSGLERNSLIEARLRANRFYELRVRLYFRNREGRTGVVFY